MRDETRENNIRFKRNTREQSKDGPNESEKYFLCSNSDIISPIIIANASQSILRLVLK